MLPDVDLTEHGLENDQARHASYRVRSGEDRLIFSNRASGEGLIQDVPCPSLESGSEVVIELETGQSIVAETKRSG